MDVHEMAAVALHCYVGHPLAFRLLRALRSRRRPLAFPLPSFVGASHCRGSHGTSRGRSRRILAMDYTSRLGLGYVGDAALQLLHGTGPVHLGHPQLPEVALALHPAEQLEVGFLWVGGEETSVLILLKMELDFLFHHIFPCLHGSLEQTKDRRLM